MKKLFCLMLLIVPMFIFAQVDYGSDSPYKDFTSIEVTDFEVQTDTVEGKLITMFTINNYEFGEACGRLVLMYTDNTMFGIKFYQSNGEVRCWAIVGNHIAELSKDIWADINT